MTDGTPPKENAFPPPPIKKFQLQVVNTLSLITLFNQGKKKQGGAMENMLGNTLGTRRTDSENR
jgi:hypothetical protein